MRGKCISFYKVLTYCIPKSKTATLISTCNVKQFVVNTRYTKLYKPQNDLCIIKLLKNNIHFPTYPNLDKEAILSLDYTLKCNELVSST